MKVEHHPEQKRFILNFDNEQAVLEYKIPKKGVVEFTRTVVPANPDKTGTEKKVIDFTHTYVPESKRGMGIAGKLVKEGVRWARSEGSRIIATCPYVRKWLDKEKTIGKSD